MRLHVAIASWAWGRLAPRSYGHSRGPSGLPGIGLACTASGLEVHKRSDSSVVV